MNDVSVYLGRRGEGPNQKNAFCACTPRFEPGVVHFYTSQTFETLVLGPKLQDKIMLTMAVSLVYVPSHTQNSQIKKRGRKECLRRREEGSKGSSSDLPSTDEYTTQYCSKTCSDGTEPVWGNPLQFYKSRNHVRCLVPLWCCYGNSCIRYG